MSENKMDKSFIQKALKKAKKHSDGKPLKSCLMFTNGIGFLFEPPDEIIYGGPGYIVVYDDGSVGSIPTIPGNIDILEKGVFVDIAGIE